MKQSRAQEVEPSTKADATTAHTAPPTPATTLWAIPAAADQAIDIVVSSATEAEATRIAGIAGLWLERGALVYPVPTRWIVTGASYDDVLGEVQRQVSNSGGAVVEGLVGHETKTLRVTLATPRWTAFTIEVSEHPGDAALRLVAHDSPFGLALGKEIVARALGATAREAERRE